MNLCALYVCRNLQRPEESIISLELELQVVMGTKPRTCGRKMGLVILL